MYDFCNYNIFYFICDNINMKRTKIHVIQNKIVCLKLIRRVYSHLSQRLYLKDCSTFVSVNMSCLLVCQRE